MKKRLVLTSVLTLTTLALLLGLTGCYLIEPENAAQVPTAAAPPSQVSPQATAAPPSPVSPLATPTRPSPAPTDDDIMPTPAPTTTPPPFPTSLPTPVVTPIPTVAPPIIPEVVGKAQQPFWIIYWQGNEVWRIDDQGKERQLLLDTYKRLGLYLTANPYLESLIDTKQQSRVVVSPDGQKLALVLVDKPGLVRQREQFTFSVYVFEIPTDKLTFLSKGASPIWSPDGKSLAFIRATTTSDGFVWDGGLWIANVATNQIYPLVKGDPADPELGVRYWTWAPDSQQIAYRYSEGIIDKHELWIKNIADSSPAYLLPNVPADTYYGCFSWMPGGQHLLCSAPDKIGLYPRPVNLWSVSVKTGERKQLTQHFIPSSARWSPDGKWLAFSAEHLYEKKEPQYDMWLLSVDGANLLRATSAQPQGPHDAGYLGGYWSPDGTRLVVQRGGIGLAILSLQTSSITSLGVNLIDMASYNYTVGGGK